MFDEELLSDVSMAVSVFASDPTTVGLSLHCSFALAGGVLLCCVFQVAGSPETRLQSVIGAQPGRGGRRRT
jgi:hypothetical protein